MNEGARPYPLAMLASETTAPVPPRKTPYLPYLAGLRGLAALYVVLFHVDHNLERNYEPFGASHALLPLRGQFLLYGHWAVTLFIIMSGFVLTLPLAAGRHGATDPRRFLTKRLQRLLPAYYVALVFAIPIWLLIVRLNDAHTSVPAVAVQVLAHAFMLHDLFDRTFAALDGPMWSVAVELQINVIFVLVLLPVSRRWGMLSSVAAAFAIGFIPTCVGIARHQEHYRLEKACFWYLGLFALGSAAAYVAYGNDARYEALKARLPWKALSFVSGFAFLALVVPSYDERFAGPSYIGLDLIFGVAVTCGFIAIANDQARGKRSIVATILSAPALVTLGSFSYSLFLINDPLILVAMKLLYGFAPIVKVVLGFGVLVPTLIGLASIYAKYVESPLRGAARRNPRTVRTADREVASA